MSFAERLIKARKKAKLTQRQLAVRSGVSQQAISKLENGGSSPSEYTMKQLASAMHIPLIDLLEEKSQTTVEDDSLAAIIMSRIQELPDPALARVSDFLDGLEAGRETEAALAAGWDPVSGSAG